MSVHGSWHTQGGVPVDPPHVAFVPFAGAAPARAVELEQPERAVERLLQRLPGRARAIGSAAPTGVAVGPQGSLFVADDQTGTIFRIRPLAGLAGAATKRTHYRMHFRSLLALTALAGLAVLAAPPARGADNAPTVPAGFSLERIARVPGARQLAVTPNGDLLVGTTGNAVYIVPDAQGSAGPARVFASFDDRPVAGVFLSGDTLYAGGQFGVYRLPYRAGEREAREKPQKIAARAHQRAVARPRHHHRRRQPRASSTPASARRATPARPSWTRPAPPCRR